MAAATKTTKSAKAKRKPSTVTIRINVDEISDELRERGFDVTTDDVRGWFPGQQQAAREFLDGREDQPEFLTSPDQTIAIAVESIDVSPYQPRTEFDKKQIAELAASIQQHGQLTDALVRKVGDRYELIGGERRWRAVKQAGIATLKCRVVSVDDDAARRMAFLDNLQRQDLSALEHARGCLELLNSNAYPDHKSLAAAIGVAKSTIANRLRVLKLPDDPWLNWVSLETFGLTMTHLRLLVPWVDRPNVLDDVAARVRDESEYSAPFTVSDIAHHVDQAIRACSRPMKGQEWIPGRRASVSVALTPTQKKNPELDLVEVEVGGGTTARAFNVELWDELQTAREAVVSARRGKSTTGAGKNSKAAEPTAAELKEKAKAAAEQKVKKLYRWKITELQRRVVSVLTHLATDGVPPGKPELAMQVSDIVTTHLLWFCVAPDGGDRREQLAAAIKSAGGRATTKAFRAFDMDVFGSLATLEVDCDGRGTLTSAVLSVLASWWSTSVEGYHRFVTPAAIEHVAGQLGITIDGDQWDWSEEFLQLLSIDELQAIAKSWNYTPKTKKKGELVTELLAQGTDSRRPAPAIVTKLKAVAL